MIYKIALSLVKYLPVKLFNELKINYENDEKIYSELKKIVQKANTKTALKIQSQIKNDEVLELAEKIYLECNNKNIEMICEDSEKYPKLLKECPDKPKLIYIKGNINPNHQDLIALVGTRNCTDYGLRNCEYFLNEFSKYKVGIVSGLAYGIDIHAHQISNKLNLPNYAVLGSGINVIYPRIHQKFADQIKENGMLISEYPPFSPPTKYNFPQRNRIIAGMTKCTIVVESSIKGGAMITGKLANDYNREVFAIPGNIDKISSQGCNSLIHHHQAHLVNHPEQVIKMLNFGIRQKKELMPNENMHQLTSEQKKIYDFIRKNSNSSFNVIQKKMNLPTSELSTILLIMELEDIISQTPGKIYQII